MSGAEKVYEAIARSLREFGYQNATAEMIRETHAAMVEDASLPHGIVGMFARNQLSEAIENGLLR